MTKITFISDTHGMHQSLSRIYYGSNLSGGGDILIHGGDVSSRGNERQVRQFLKWFDNIEGYKHKIFIAGNHDFIFERRPDKIKEILKDYSNDIIYLEDSWCMIDDIKIYGFPWQPKFYDWAFNLEDEGERMEEKIERIPDDVDTLITHGPPFGILDRTAREGLNVGSKSVAKRVKKIKPHLHLFGHIHEGYGLVEENDIIYINGSVLDEKYIIQNKPVKIDITDEEINIIR